MYSFIGNCLFSSSTHTNICELATEEVFHAIFSKFFPLGAENYNGKKDYLLLYILFCVFCLKVFLKNL